LAIVGDKINECRILMMKIVGKYLLERPQKEITFRWILGRQAMRRRGGSGSCPVADFGISGGEHTGSVTTVLSG
jgi:hypothetical protein